MRIAYDLTHCYLEIARGALTSIHHPSLRRDELVGSHGHGPLANATLALVSMSVIYSFMAIESFVNYQLFRLWERRKDGSTEGNAFIRRFGDISDFNQLRDHKHAQELPKRFKSLCHILDYDPPYETIPDTWRRFITLVERSRHFLIHPLPQQDYFQNNMQQIMEETKSGEYVEVVQEMLEYLFKSESIEPPSWLTQNTLFRFGGIELLVQ